MMSDEALQRSERRRRVFLLLLDFKPHDTMEICSVYHGGSEGTRRLRELRADEGYVIHKRRKPDSEQYEYWMERGDDGRPRKRYERASVKVKAADVVGHEAQGSLFD